MNWQRSEFLPPRWLRSPHLQSVLSSSPLRAIRARRRLHAIAATHETVVLDVGNDVRLQGVHSLPQGVQPQNMDGEVAQFQCITPQQLQAWLLQDCFTPEASLILADHLGW